MSENTPNELPESLQLRTEAEHYRLGMQVYEVALSNYEMLTDIAPDALVVDEYFSPHCHWIDDDPVALLLEFLDRASCLLREDV